MKHSTFILLLLAVLTLTGYAGISTLQSARTQITQHQTQLEDASRM